MVVRTDGARGCIAPGVTDGLPGATSRHPSPRRRRRRRRRAMGGGPAARASRTRSGEPVPVRRRPARKVSGRRQAEVKPEVSAERDISRRRRGRRGRRPPYGSGRSGAGSSSWSRLLSHRRPRRDGGPRNEHSGFRQRRASMDSDSSRRPVQALRRRRDGCGPRAARTARAPARLDREGALERPWGQITGDGVVPDDDPAAPDEAGGSSSATQSSSSARNVCHTA